MTNTANPNILRHQLAQFLSTQTGQVIAITQLTPLAGGASRESWLVETTAGGTAHKWVLRKDLPTTMNDDALTRAQEYSVMQTAHDAGVQVARMRFLCEDPNLLGLPFFLMDYVEGVSIGRKVITQPELAQARAVLPEQLAQQLAKIHTINPDAPQLSFLMRPADTKPALTALRAAYSTLDKLGVSVPALEYGLRWCTRHAPASDRITVLHGDFRVGNLLVDEAGLAAVIDWEFAHIGDPVEDIGYLCMRDWRFGNDQQQVGGLCDRERFLTAYEQHSGQQIDRAAADWWEIIGNLRWAIICLAQAERHLSGQDVSVELASLGRRSAEMQLEALRLIERAGG
ncbi:MAG: phosphotransferase family protein [Armatimonadetes bacterium]|nr:phosphotransferase family protein [Anaerolineae bacterium]